MRQKSSSLIPSVLLSFQDDRTEPKIMPCRGIFSITPWVSVGTCG